MTGRKPFTWRLALFVILSVGLLLWTLKALGAFSIGRSYRLQATFVDASGLLVGSEVLLAGVPVGRVEKIELDDQHRALVTLSVADDVRLAPAVEAAIRARSMLGEKAIALSPAPPGPAGPFLADGDRIDNALVEADLLSLASQAGKAMEGISQAVSDLGGLAETLSGLTDKLDLESLGADLHAVGELARASQGVLERQEGAVTDTLAVLRDTAAVLTERARQAAAPIEKLDALLGELRDAGTVPEASAMLGELRTFTRDAAPELLDTLRTLRTAIAGQPGNPEQPGLAARAERATRGAETFFADASSLVQRFERISSGVEQTLHVLEETLENVGKITPHEIRKILQEEGVKVKVLLLD